MTATTFLRTTAGRFCPADYRYPVATFARMPDFEAETIYVVGGLYGNRLALDAVERRAEQENGKVEVVYNGDFHWFDTDPHGFSAVQSRVLACRALRGNVETEIARADGEADVGCGCAYPDTIADAVVERSNTIFSRLRQTAVNISGSREQLAALPMHLVVQLGGCRVGIVHGDAESLAGWRFGHEALDDDSTLPWLDAVGTESNIGVFCSSHTCLPAMREFAFHDARLVIANNGAAGLPNFAGTHFGLITRMSIRPAPRPALYGVRVADAFIDAMPVEFDHARWLRSFESNWPAGSPAHMSYHSRIVNGPDFSLTSAMPVSHRRVTANGHD